jgi:hypothetical protein
MHLLIHSLHEVDTVYVNRIGLIEILMTRVSFQSVYCRRGFILVRCKGVMRN